MYNFVNITLAFIHLSFPPAVCVIKSPGIRKPSERKRKLSTYPDLTTDEVAKAFGMDPDADTTENIIRSL